MRLSNILLILIIVVLCYLLYSYMMAPVSLTTIADGKTKTVIPAEHLANSSHTNNFTYSIWFYISDWNYMNGESKTLLSRLDNDGNPVPTIMFEPMQNNLDINLTTYPSHQSKAGKVHKCKIQNIPLQKWVNLLISVYGRSLDVYLDGKLVRTCLLPGVARVETNNPLYITPNHGFAGYTARLQYTDGPTNPQQAWNIYKAGFGGGSALGNLFNKFRLKVSFLKDNKEHGSLEL